MLPSDAQACAAQLEHARREPRGHGAQAGVEPLLGRRVLAVEPDGQAAAGLDLAGDLGERPARVGRVVEDADREDQVERAVGQAAGPAGRPGRCRRSGGRRRAWRPSRPPRSGPRRSPGPRGCRAAGNTARRRSRRRARACRRAMAGAMPVLTRNVASSSSGRAPRRSGSTAGRSWPRRCRRPAAGSRSTTGYARRRPGSRCASGGSPAGSSVPRHRGHSSSESSSRFMIRSYETEATVSRPSRRVPGLFPAGRREESPP